MVDLAASVSVVILCKDEERTITTCLKQIVQQSLLRRKGVDVEIAVVANGCNDHTVTEARCFAKSLELRGGAQITVFDLPQGGKSRSWNRAVHELISTSSTFIIFVDSDIELVDNEVFGKLVDYLTENPATACYVGYPLKSIAKEDRRGILDNLSLLVSRQTRYTDAINGSLYVVRREEVSDIWLPDETMGEDGFLNAMVTTRGFTQDPVPGRVVQARNPTHYFEEHTAVGFIRHERRMLVATVVNCWIFELLWSLRCSEPVGPLIRRWNEERPAWVHEVVERNTAGRWWTIPRSMIFSRFKSPSEIGVVRFAARLPISLVATMLTIPPAILANQALRKKRSSDVW